MHACQAPSIKEQKAIYDRKEVKGTTTTYHGILAFHSEGTLRCEVSYDTNKYSGKIINDGYEIEDWLSMGISADKAKQHYLELAKQEPK